MVEPLVGHWRLCRWLVLLMPLSMAQAERLAMGGRVPLEASWWWATRTEDDAHGMNATQGDTASTAPPVHAVNSESHGAGVQRRSVRPHLLGRHDPKDGHDCDSAVHILEGMLEESKWYELLLSFAILASSLSALGLCCFVLGWKVKPRPPKYWQTWPPHPFSDRFDAEVDVTHKLREPVQRLLDLTTKPSCMGLGQDGSWATHKHFRVLKVTRIEHGRMWSKYSRIRDSISRVEKSLAKMQPQWLQFAERALKTIDEANAEREADPLVRGFLDKLGLDKSRNERILFHGSPSVGSRNAAGEVMFASEEVSPAFAICREGFDDRLGSAKGMYGAGTYFADMASKADQYAGRYNDPALDKGSVGEKATMFLARVVLGCPYITNQSLEQLRRPPCIEGHFDLNLLWNEDVKFGTPWSKKGLPLQICMHRRFDSVLGDYVVDSKKRLYREYVVYEQQSYPEFCVEYERLP